ncbi:MAG: DUF418 domain-containing protein [Pseudonocardia sp.]
MSTCTGAPPASAGSRAICPRSIGSSPLLPAWTFGLGGRIELWQAALIGLGTWGVILVIAAWSARAGYCGPAEILLRKLTYGPRRSARASGLRRAGLSHRGAP